MKFLPPAIVTICYLPLAVFGLALPKRRYNFNPQHQKQQTSPPQSHQQQSSRQTSHPLPYRPPMLPANFKKNSNTNYSPLRPPSSSLQMMELGGDVSFWMGMGVAAWLSTQGGRKPNSSRRDGVGVMDDNSEYANSYYYTPEQSQAAGTTTTIPDALETMSYANHHHEAEFSMPRYSAYSYPYDADGEGEAQEELYEPVFHIQPPLSPPPGPPVVYAEPVDIAPKVAPPRRVDYPTSWDGQIPEYIDADIEDRPYSYSSDFSQQQGAQDPTRWAPETSSSSSGSYMEDEATSSQRYDTTESYPAPNRGYGVPKTGMGSSSYLDDVGRGTSSYYAPPSVSPPASDSTPSVVPYGVPEPYPAAPPTASVDGSYWSSSTPWVVPKAAPKSAPRPVSSEQSFLEDVTRGTSSSSSQNGVRKGSYSVSSNRFGAPRTGMGSLYLEDLGNGGPSIYSPPSYSSSESDAVKSATASWTEHVAASSTSGSPGSFVDAEVVEEEKEDYYSSASSATSGGVGTSTTKKSYSVSSKSFKAARTGMGSYLEDIPSTSTQSTYVAPSYPPPAAAWAPASSPAAPRVTPPRTSTPSNGSFVNAKVVEDKPKAANGTKKSYSVSNKSFKTARTGMGSYFEDVSFSGSSSSAYPPPPSYQSPSAQQPTTYQSPSPVTPTASPTRRPIPSNGSFVNAQKPVDRQAKSYSVSSKKYKAATTGMGSYFEKGGFHGASGTSSAYPPPASSYPTPAPPTSSSYASSSPSSSSGKQGYSVSNKSYQNGASTGTGSYFEKGGFHRAGTSSAYPPPASSYPTPAPSATTPSSSYANPSVKKAYSVSKNSYKTASSTGMGSYFEKGGFGGSSSSAYTPPSSPRRRPVVTTQAHASSSPPVVTAIPTTIKPPVSPKGSFVDAEIVDDDDDDDVDLEPRMEEEEEESYSYSIPDKSWSDGETEMESYSEDANSSSDTSSAYSPPSYPGSSESMPTSVSVDYDETSTIPSSPTASWDESTDESVDDASEDSSYLDSMDGSASGVGAQNSYGMANKNFGVATSAMGSYLDGVGSSTPSASTPPSYAETEQPAPYESAPATTPVSSGGSYLDAIAGNSAQGSVKPSYSISSKSFKSSPVDSAARSSTGSYLEMMAGGAPGGTAKNTYAVSSKNLNAANTGTGSYLDAVSGTPAPTFTQSNSPTFPESSTETAQNSDTNSNTRISKNSYVVSSKKFSAPKSPTGLGSSYLDNVATATGAPEENQSSYGEASYSAASSGGSPTSLSPIDSAASAPFTSMGSNLPTSSPGSAAGGASNSFSVSNKSFNAPKASPGIGASYLDSFSSNGSAPSWGSGASYHKPAFVSQGDYQNPETYEEPANADIEYQSIYEATDDFSSIQDFDDRKAALEHYSPDGNPFSRSSAQDMSRET